MIKILNKTKKFSFLLLFLCIISCLYKKHNFFNEINSNKINLSNILTDNKKIRSLKISDNKVLLRSKKRSSKSTLSIFNIETSKILFESNNIYSRNSGEHLNIHKNNLVFNSTLKPEIINVFDIGLDVYKETKIINEFKESRSHNIYNIDSLVILTGSMNGIHLSSNKKTLSINNEKAEHLEYNIVSFPLSSNINLHTGHFINDSIKNYAINKELEILWTYSFLEEKTLNRSTQSMKNPMSVLSFNNSFAVSYLNKIVCLNRETGEVIWAKNKKYKSLELFKYNDKVVIMSIKKNELYPNRYGEEEYLFEVAVIDSNNGKSVWNYKSNSSKVYPKLGILNTSILLLKSDAFMQLDIESGRIVYQVDLFKKEDMNSFSFTSLKDFNTGKYYVKHKNTLYW